MTRIKTLRSPVHAIALALFACIAAPAAMADDAAASPALQARLDALQHITVTEARTPAADVAPPSAEVDAVLHAAAAEETAAAASPGADVVDTGAAAR